MAGNQENRSCAKERLSLLPLPSEILFGPFSRPVAHPTDEANRNSKNAKTGSHRNTFEKRPFEPEAFNEFPGHQTEEENGAPEQNGFCRTAYRE